jgi:hypothetical protein
MLMLAFTGLLSVTTYLVASNQALNFLEQRESVSLTLQIVVAVGGLLVLLGSADSVSGERERGTLETLLLTPAPRRAIVVGKGAAALSRWAGSLLLTVPYVWYLGHGVGVAGVALGSALLVGTLLSFLLVGSACSSAPLHGRTGSASPTRSSFCSPCTHPARCRARRRTVGCQAGGRRRPTCPQGPRGPGGRVVVRGRSGLGAGDDDPGADAVQAASRHR